MSNTDALLSRYAGEIEERQAFINTLVEAAQAETRDLNPQEMELITRARDRIQIVNGQLEPLRETVRITRDSAESMARLAAEQATARSPELAQEVKYRSAGSYIIDRWRAGLGEREALERLDIYHRAAAHQTTSDNPGLLPEQIMGPVINWVDQSRPLVAALGPRDLPSGSWSRPRVTQHTSVGVQAGEKTELASRKMLIEKVPVSAVTYGGYVNLSRQDADWSQPSIYDLLIQDLAGQYAIQTEDAAATALEAAATAGATGLGTTPTPGEVSGALWAAAAAVFSATQGNGRVLAVVAPDMLGLIGPLFPPVNPQNAASSGFNAGAFGTGAMGSIGGIPIYVSSAITAGTGLVMSSSAAEVYEDRGGPLQVVEPSVLGIQLAYYGYFATVVMEDSAIIKITSA